MNRVLGQLRLYSPPAADAPPGVREPCDPNLLANRELIRPATYRHAHRRLEAYSKEWFAELEAKRYARHGRWLEGALEFGRHPGEPILLLNPGLGSDAIRFMRCGTEVTLAIGEGDDPSPILANLARSGLAVPIVNVTDSRLPFPDGLFDVVVFNALHDSFDLPKLTDELFRVLKCGGKVIGLFPAYYDTGYWQDLLLPLQRWYWRRPADPTTASKTTARELRRTFHRFTENKVFKRHLRRSELPHLIRLWPLVLLERFYGRVLVIKARKPISAARVIQTAEPAEAVAA